MSSDRLCEAVRLCEACPLGVRGVGVPGMYLRGPGWTDNSCNCLREPHLCKCEHVDVMILGEAPGAVEQAKGQPFVGGSGQLLHSLLKDAGLTSYYVSNIAKHHPWDRSPPRPHLESPSSPGELHESNLAYRYTSQRGARSHVRGGRDIHTQSRPPWHNHHRHHHHVQA